MRGVCLTIVAVETQQCILCVVELYVTAIYTNVECCTTMFL